MKLELKDFYGQYITIHDETASRNIRIEVKTTKDLNKVRVTKPEDCDTVTDISLPIETVVLIKNLLEAIIQRRVYGR